MKQQSATYCYADIIHTKTVVMKPSAALIAVIAPLFSASYAMASSVPAAITVEATVADTLRPLPGEPLTIPMPIELTAKDFVTKIYGVLDPTANAEEISRKSTELMNLTPSADRFGLWLETSDGYAIDYYGMTPDVSAMARFDSGDVSDFGFFFLFPYEAADKNDANKRQSEFCGAMLQEMHDIGVILGVDGCNETLFDVIGEYDGNLVEVRLIDEEKSGGDGRFVLMLSVEPGAFTATDRISAEESHPEVR